MIFSPRVLEIAKAELIGEHELAEMCRRAALSTHGSFNRRFHAWLFDIRDGVCQNMRMATTQTIGKISPNWVEEEHEDCDGKGCHTCGWAGTIIRYL